MPPVEPFERRGWESQGGVPTVEGRAIGALLMGVGLALLAMGAVIYFGWLSFVGRLPGDIRFESENVKIYVPLASMLVISLLLTILLNLFRRLF